MNVKEIRKKRAREAASCDAVRRGGEVYRALDLPEKAYSRFPCAEIAGDSQIYVENHCGVLEVGCEKVRLYTELGIMRIEGSGLNIRNADKKSVLIDGRIDAVYYENREEKSKKDKN